MSARDELLAGRALVTFMAKTIADPEFENLAGWWRLRQIELAMAAPDRVTFEDCQQRTAAVESFLMAVRNEVVNREELIDGRTKQRASAPERSRK